MRDLRWRPNNSSSSGSNIRPTGDDAILSDHVRGEGLVRSNAPADCSGHRWLLLFRRTLPSAGNRGSDPNIGGNVAGDRGEVMPLMGFLFQKYAIPLM